jgi:hypothetical protein
MYLEQVESERNIKLTPTESRAALAGRYRVACIEKRQVVPLVQAKITQFRPKEVLLNGKVRNGSANALGLNNVWMTSRSRHHQRSWQGHVKIVLQRQPLTTSVAARTACRLGSLTLLIAALETTHMAYR